MALNLKKMRENKEDADRGGEIFKPAAGSYKVYIHGQCRPNDEDEPTVGTNYIPLVTHWIDKKQAVCLDSDRNQIINHPFIREALKKRKEPFKIPKGSKCPICQAIEAGTLDKKLADDAKPSTRYVWGLTPLAFRPKGAEDFSKLRPKPSVGLFGPQLHWALQDVFIEQERDITDPEAASYVYIERTGTGFDTKYKARIDKATEATKDWKKIGPKFRAMLLKALEVGGDCDLFRLSANFIKPHDEVKAMISGVAVDLAEDDFEDEDEDLIDGADGVEDDEDFEDDELEGAEDEADEDEADEDEDLMDDDEDFEDDEVEEEPEPEPKPAPKKKAAKKKAPAKKKAAAKPAPEPDEDDEDDEDDDLGLDELDELDAELERISAAKGKKRKRA